MFRHCKLGLMLVCLTSQWLLLGLAVRASSAVETLGSPCPDVSVISLNEVLGYETSTVIEGSFLIVDVPSAGVLELTSPGTTLDFLAARMDSTAEACSRSRRTLEVTFTEGTHDGQMMGIASSGRYLFQVVQRGARADERAATEVFFAPMTVVQTNHYVASPPDRAGVAIRQTDFYRLGLTFKNEEEEVDPDPYENSRKKPIFSVLEARLPLRLKNEEEEVDPDPYRGEALSTLRGRLVLISEERSGPTFAKNEEEEVDPDPYRKASAPVGGVEGWLSLDEKRSGGWQKLRQGLVDLAPARRKDSRAPAALGAAHRFLAEVLVAEAAVTELLATATLRAVGD